MSVGCCRWRSEDGWTDGGGSGGWSCRAPGGTLSDLDHPMVPTRMDDIVGGHRGGHEHTQRDEGERGGLHGRSERVEVGGWTGEGKEASGLEVTRVNSVQRLGSHDKDPKETDLEVGCVGRECGV